MTWGNGTTGIVGLVSAANSLVGASPLVLGLATYGNMIFLPFNEPGHRADAPVWSHTTLVVFSEFSRTPLVNGRDGRDHHLTNSCLVAGPGLLGNRAMVVVSEDADEAFAVAGRLFRLEFREVPAAAPMVSTVSASAAKPRSATPVWRWVQPGSRPARRSRWVRPTPPR